MFVKRFVMNVYNIDTRSMVRGCLLVYIPEIFRYLYGPLPRFNFTNSFQTEIYYA